MGLTIADLNKGERGIITDSSSNNIPLKLLEMGCLPGNEVILIQVAPFSDPLYLNIYIFGERRAESPILECLEYAPTYQIQF